MDPLLYKSAMEGDIAVIGRQNAAQFQVQLTPNKNTLLHVAAQFGQIECVKEILQKCGGSLLCSMNIKGDTALHISARDRFTDIVKALVEFANKLDGELESGTKITKEMLRMRNEEGDTALHDAVRNNNFDVVEILILEDPHFVHPPNNAEETPLFLAAEKGMVSIILDNCTTPTYNGPNGRTALHAATFSFLSSDCIGRLQVWKPSLIKETDVYGWTPLHYAAKNNDTNVIKELLDFDNSVAYFVSDNDDKMTALHIAANQGHVNVMKELLLHCPDCWEMTNNKGQNILHIATEYEQEEIIKFLLNKSFFSSLVNQKDKDGNAPSHLVAAKFKSKWLSFVQHPAVGQHAAVDIKTFRKFLSAIIMPLRQILSFILEAFHLDVGITSSLMGDVLFHPRTSKRVVNKKNLTPLEVARGKAFRWNCRMEPKTDEEKKDVDKREKVSQDTAKTPDTHLIVATLIATVTFAAGFTVPGGYNDNGPGQGMAVLTRRAAFKAFVLTDTIALVLSVTAVFLHVFACIYTDGRKRTDRYFSALLLILAAMGSMMVAFMTGLYVVLADSLYIAITVCVICCFFFLTASVILGKAFRDGS